MRALSFLPIIFFWSLSTLPAQPSPGSFQEAWEVVTQHLDQRLEQAGIVGGSLYFLKDGEEAGKHFYGYADLDSGRRIDEQTIFHWASITKTFTGIALLQLRDRGLLSLDDPIVKYLPELQSVHNPYTRMEDITLRLLLSHAAGFRSSTWPWGGDKDWHPFEPKEWSQLAAMLPYTEIEFQPGSRYQYSNPGITFLGRVVEVITGDDIEVYIDKNILKPLGMSHSYFDVTPYFLLPYRANSYYLADGTLTANGLDFDTGVTVGNGGLNASVPDMTKYLNFLLGINDNGNYDLILQRSSLEEMWQPVLPTNQTEGNLQEQIGLIFFVLDHTPANHTNRFIGHTGQQQGFFSFFYIHLATATACIFNLNTFNTEATPDKYAPNRSRLTLNQTREEVFDHLFGFWMK